MMPVWRRLGQFADLFRGHHRNKAVGATAVLVLLAAFLTLVKADFRLSSEGVIRPSQRAQVFSNVPGVVETVLVRDGDNVKEGQLLATLANPSLEAEYVEVEGQFLATQAEHRTLMRQRMMGSRDKKNGQDEQHEKEKAELFEGLLPTRPNLSR